MEMGIEAVRRRGTGVEVLAEHIKCQVVSREIRLVGGCGKMGIDAA